ncbi:MAG: heparan-alpha-glucosaminide N-acetyltransferase domain-containing protein [Bryobacteraceae bacterium]
MFLQSLLKPARVSLNQISAPLPNDGNALYWGLLVLSGLGLTMIVCGLLMRLRPWAWLLVAALCVLATNSLLPASGKPGPWWTLILLTPGLSQHLLVIYPVIPWLAGAAAGMYFGYWWRGNPVHANLRIGIVGAVLVSTGLALRVAGGWGNIRLPRDPGWIEFLNNVKYPPSLVFWAISLGINLLLLALLLRLPEKLKSKGSPLIVFGQTPLFFYLAHFYLLAICAFAFFREAASLETMYLVWALLLVALYPICSWYRSFKLTRSENSLWRLF